ncbi:hypothetical protein KCP69_02800 [Salmonella enterica subsp. enterica]|nr:hypothetical protein KCP69_02800 [Salmonella enterica subsp. enterica]
MVIFRPHRSVGLWSIKHRISFDLIHSCRPLRFSTMTSRWFDSSVVCRFDDCGHFPWASIRGRIRRSDNFPSLSSIQ